MADLAAKRSRTRTGLAVSTLLHLAFVAAAILSLPWQGPPPEPRGFQVSLVAPPLPAERIRPRTQQRPSASPAPSAAPIAPTAVAPAPSTAASLAAVPAPAGDDQGLGRVRAMLRGSVGCSEEKFAHLSQQELDRCAKWRQAHLDPDLVLPAPIAPEKRAWFEASLAARHSASHPPGFVCGLLIDGIHFKIPKTPPHALKLGPAPCYVIPPKWIFSEEADVQTPSKRDGEQRTLAFTPRQFLSNDTKQTPGGPPPIDLGNSPGR